MLNSYFASFPWVPLAAKSLEGIENIFPPSLQHKMKVEYINRRERKKYRYIYIFVCVWKGQLYFQGFKMKLEYINRRERKKYRYMYLFTYGKDSYNFQLFKMKLEYINRREERNIVMYIHICLWKGQL